MQAVVLKRDVEGEPLLPAGERRNLTRFDFAVIMQDPGIGTQYDPLCTLGFAGWRVRCGECSALFGQFQRVGELQPLPTPEAALEWALDVAFRYGIKEIGGRFFCPACQPDIDPHKADAVRLTEGAAPDPSEWL